MKKLVYFLMVGLAVTALQVTLVDAHQCSDNTPGSYYATGSDEVWHECPVNAEEIFTKEGWIDQVDHLIPVGHQEGNEPFVCDRFKCRRHLPRCTDFFDDWKNDSGAGMPQGDPKQGCDLGWSHGVPQGTKQRSFLMDMGRVADEGRRTAGPCSTCEEVLITKRRGAFCPTKWDPAGGKSWYQVRVGGGTWCVCGKSAVKWPYRRVDMCMGDKLWRRGPKRTRGDATIEVKEVVGCHRNISTPACKGGK